MLEEQIQKDYIQAMKNKDQLRSSTLSFLRAQLKNIRIDKKLNNLEDAEVIAVIKKQIKQREDSIAQYQGGGRQDLADKEKAEMLILRQYLPQEIPEGELQSLIKQAMDEVQASTVKDMGKVMKLALQKVQGRADSKRVSTLVQQALAQR